MSLPELRRKGDHMPKSITWILFNSKCDVERLKEIEKESKERDQAEGSHHPWIQ